MARQGYIDYQRTVNWDGPLALNINGVEFTTKQVTEVLDVQRYAYLAGRMKPSLQNIEVKLQWFADAAGTISVGFRTFTLSASIVAAIKFRILNEGPYVQLEFKPPIEPKAWVLTAQIFPSNRAHPLEVVPGTPVVMNEVFNLVAKETRVMVPNDYATGPCGVHLVSGFTTVAFRFFFFPGPASESIFTERVLTKGQVVDTTIVMPLGAWLVKAENPEAEASVGSSCIVTPSITGSS